MCKTFYVKAFESYRLTDRQTDRQTDRIDRNYKPRRFAGGGSELGKSSESVQCAVLKACDACADMGQL